MSLCKRRKTNTNLYMHNYLLLTKAKKSEAGEKRRHVNVETRHWCIILCFSYEMFLKAMNFWKIAHCNQTSAPPVLKLTGPGKKEDNFWSCLPGCLLLLWVGLKIIISDLSWIFYDNSALWLEWSYADFHPSISMTLKLLWKNFRLRK